MIKITVLAFYLLREQEVLPMAKNKKTRKVTVKKKQAAKRNQGMHRVPRANRKYKDTVFRMLFSDKENLLSLYIYQYFRKAFRWMRIQKFRFR